MGPADINRAITSTLTIARNEYKYVADVSTELGELPSVVCQVGDLNQAMLNMIVNAAHAIEARVAEGERGEIADHQSGRRRRGRHLDPRQRVRDSDGAPRQDLRSVRFTTKPLGKGSGQGLAIVRAIVVEKLTAVTSTSRALSGKGRRSPSQLPTRPHARIAAEA